MEINSFFYISLAATGLLGTAQTLCLSHGFEYCFGHEDKKPTVGIEVQQESAGREYCLMDCVKARYPRTVFYNDATTTCYCTMENVTSLGLVQDTGGICMEMIDYIETWVTSVIDFSTEYNYPDPRYSATRILGVPDVYPSAGDIPGAWCANVVDDNQWIEVGIPEALHLFHVYIYETFNPGGLKTLSVRDTSNNWHVVWNSPQIQALGGSRIFDPDFQMPTFKVNGFRLDVDLTVAGNWVQYDAIQVVGRK